MLIPKLRIPSQFLLTNSGTSYSGPADVTDKSPVRGLRPKRSPLRTVNCQRGRGLYDAKTDRLLGLLVLQTSVFQSR